MDFKIRRAVRPDFTLPSGALYFRPYEVGAPSRRADVWTEKPLGAISRIGSPYSWPFHWNDDPGRCGYLENLQITFFCGATGTYMEKSRPGPGLRPGVERLTLFCRAPRPACPRRLVTPVRREMVCASSGTTTSDAS